MTMSVADVFEAIAAGWGEHVQCNITTGAGTRCRRRATWHVNKHGCEQAEMCTQHLRQWHVRVDDAASHGPLICAQCRRRFRGITDGATVVRL